jgi:ketosteroid isomerase-like protein
MVPTLFRLDRHEIKHYSVHKELHSGETAEVYPATTQQELLSPSRMTRFAALLVTLLLARIGANAPAAAADDAAQAQIRTALTLWMDDFNAGRADKVCGLFAPDLRANVRGVPERDYGALCDLLQRSLADRSRHYAYALDIKEISVWGEVAVVRLVWTLTVNQNGADTLSVEPGMDIFARQPDGTWKITRFMAYQQ